MKRSRIMLLTAATAILAAGMLYGGSVSNPTNTGLKVEQWVIAKVWVDGTPNSPYPHVVHAQGYIQASGTGDVTYGWAAKDHSSALTVAHFKNAASKRWPVSWQFPAAVPSMGMLALENERGQAKVQKSFRVECKTK